MSNLHDNEQAIRATSWVHLQELLFHDVYDVQLGRYRSSYVYRGLGDNSFPLQTSLMRLGGRYALLERHILRNFRKYARQVSAQGYSVWHWLSIAQHHGLPTRLLDWTYSPFIALHFATSDINSYKQDGVIWAVNYVKANAWLPPQLTDIIHNEGSNVFTAEMLHQACNTLADLDAFVDEPFVAFLEPPSLDERITNQYALFSLMNGNDRLLSEWLQSHPELYFKIIIPSELKWEVRDKLDQANITERVLFPGLEGLSQWLKRLYSPASNNALPA